MKKILIITAVWRRPQLTQIVLDYYHRMSKESGMDIRLLAVGSEGKASERLCVDNGWDYIEYPNEPVSQKFNALAKSAEWYDPDLTILTGSDDLISEGVIRHYHDTVPADSMDLHGLADIYFHFTYKEPGQRDYYFNGYGPMGIIKTLGAGRCFSRSIMEACNYRPWKNYKVNRALDTHCSQYLKRFGIKEKPVSMKDAGGIAVDIKTTGENLTSFHKLEEVLHPSHSDILERAFPEEMEKVKALTLKPAI